MMIPGVGGEKSPVVGIVVTAFEPFTGLIIAGDSRRMTYRIQKDDETVVEVSLMPRCNQPEGKEGTSAFLDIIKGAYDLGVDMPYKMTKIVGCRVRVTAEGIEISGGEVRSKKLEQIMRLLDVLKSVQARKLEQK
jgi:hypothetical protein